MWIAWEITYRKEILLKNTWHEVALGYFPSKEGRDEFAGTYSKQYWPKYKLSRMLSTETINEDLKSRNVENCEFENRQSYKNKCTFWYFQLSIKLLRLEQKPSILESNTFPHIIWCQFLSDAKIRTNLSEERWIWVPGYFTIKNGFGAIDYQDFNARIEMHSLSCD